MAVIELEQFRPCPFDISDEFQNTENIIQAFFSSGPTKPVPNEAFQPSVSNIILLQTQSSLQS